MPTIDYKNAKGEKVSGVTTIIGGNLGWKGEGLNHWNYYRGYDDGYQDRDEGKLKEYHYKRDIEKAADAGTIAHYLVECDIKGIKPDTSTFDKELLDKAETAFLNFLHWEQMVSFEPIAVEPHLVSEQYQYGLTPDLIARIQGKLALPDWKTGNAVYEDHLIQLAAYKHGWEETHPDQLITGGFHLIRFDKETAAFTYHYWDNLDDAWICFLSLLQLHNAHKQLKKLAR